MLFKRASAIMYTISTKQDVTHGSQPIAIDEVGSRDEKHCKEEKNDKIGL